MGGVSASGAAEFNHEKGTLICEKQHILAITPEEEMEGYFWTIVNPPLFFPSRGSLKLSQTPQDFPPPLN